MLQSIVPKLPMKYKQITKAFYQKIGFEDIGIQDFDGYLILQNGLIELHFFEFKDLNPLENYGQVYIRVSEIDNLYQSFLKNNIPIHPNGKLQVKPWNQKEFSILDPDYNLITFGEEI